MASYFELAFVFKVEYPTEAQTVITLMQLTVASYRDESGTLTASRKETMSDKVRKYFSVIGDIQCRPLGRAKWAIALGAIFRGATF